MIISGGPPDRTLKKKLISWIFVASQGLSLVTVSRTGLLFIYSFYIWLRWVPVAACGLSLVAVSRTGLLFTYSFYICLRWVPVAACGLSLVAVSGATLLSLAALKLHSAVASLVAEHGLSCCGDQP